MNMFIRILWILMMSNLNSFNFNSIIYEIKLRINYIGPILEFAVRRKGAKRDCHDSRFILAI